MFMVLTRSQTTKTDQRELENMEYSSDHESERSVPEVLSRDQMTEFENGEILGRRNNSEQNSVEQRFLEMNKQISDLTSLVLALTEKISSSNREGNEPNTVLIIHEARSDKILSRVLRRLRRNIMQRPFCFNRNKDSYRVLTLAVLLGYGNPKPVTSTHENSTQKNPHNLARRIQLVHR